MKSIRRKLKRGVLFLVSLLRLKRPYVVIMVDGGLASQLNKYIVGYHIKKNTNWEVKYDLSWYDTHGKCIQGVNPRAFKLLDYFPAIDDFHIATAFESKITKSIEHVENDKPFLAFDKLRSLEKFVYIGGYLNHSDYIKDYPFEQLNMKVDLVGENLKVNELILASENSVSLHVRRGDYVGSIHDVLTSDYFIRALNYIESQIEGDPQLYVFSNDPDWVRSILLPKLEHISEICVVDSNSESDGGIDFFLMSQCEYNICSNSGFSFFASLLNSDNLKKTIIPDQWIISEDAFAEGASEAFIDSGVSVIKV